MPNDAGGTAMIYPSNRTNPQSVYYTGTSNNRIILGRSLLDSQNETGNILSFGAGNDDAQLMFLTSSGYDPSKISPIDHARYKTQEHMQDKNDWQNVEATTYVNVTDANINNGMLIWRIRCGNDKFKSGDCEATGYEIALRIDGFINTAKMQYNGAKDPSNWKSGVGDIESRWIGFKACVFNIQDNNVKIEIYVDENDNNNWKRIRTETDTGNWGNKGDHCGGEKDEIITWGGPIVHLFFNFSDQSNTVKFKKLSVREIDPEADFDGSAPNVGSGNTGGSSSGGGANDTGDDSSSGNGSCGCTDRPPNSTGSSSGGQADKYGVLSRYATGEQRTDFEEDFRGNSKRWDFTNVKFTNYELRGYFKASSNVNDEVSAVLGGGRHSSNSSPRSYSVGIDSDDGSNPRYRFEEDHPNYEAGQSGNGTGQGGGIGIVGQWVGFSFVIRNVSDGVLLEIWQDQGDNSGEDPANQWKLIASWVDTKFNQKSRPSDHMAILRIDGNVDAVDYKNVCLHEIVDSDSTDPATGGSSGGSSGGGSDSGDFDWDTGGSGSGKDSGGTGDGTGGTGGGVDTPPPPPPPPPEVYQTAELELMWNINFTSGNPCNVNAPPEAIELQEVFTSEGDDAYIDIPKNFKSGGWYVNTDSVLIGRKIRQMKIWMKKVGTPLLGDININIYNGTNDLVDSFDTTLAVNALDGNNTEYVFDRDNPQRTLQEGDRISIDWTGGDGDTANYIRIEITEQDKVDSTATCLFISDDNEIIEVNEPYDLAGSIYI